MHGVRVPELVWSLQNEPTPPPGPNAQQQQQSAPGLLAISAACSSSLVIDMGGEGLKAGLSILNVGIRMYSGILASVWKYRISPSVPC